MLNSVHLESINLMLFFYLDPNIFIELFPFFKKQIRKIPIFGLDSCVQNVINISRVWIV